MKLISRTFASALVLLAASFSAFVSQCVSQNGRSRVKHVRM
jgi:hypothetical protein